MQRTVEAMLGYFNQIRQVYANKPSKTVEEERCPPNESSVLILLSNNRTINTASQLKVILGVSKGLVSRSVESLAAKGLVECRQDELDRRIQRIYLTDRASPLVSRLEREIKKINEVFLEGISQEEIDQMEATMTKILDRFAEKGER